MVNIFYRPQGPLSQSGCGQRTRARRRNAPLAAPSTALHLGQKVGDARGAREICAATSCLVPSKWPAGVWPLALLIAFQTLRAVEFRNDVVSDLTSQPWADVFSVTNLSKIAATLGLGIGLMFGAFVLKWR